MHDIVASIDLGNADPDLLFDRLQRILDDRSVLFRVEPNRKIVFEDPFLITAWMPASKVSRGEISVVQHSGSSTVNYNLSLRTLRIGVIATAVFVGAAFLGQLLELGGDSWSSLLGSALVPILAFAVYFLNTELYSGVFKRQIQAKLKGGPDGPGRPG